MKGKIRKQILKSCLSFLLAFTMLISQGVNTFAIVVGVELETGGVPTPNITKVSENLTRTDGTTVAGDTLQYTITIMNDEEFSTWKDVWLYDCIPAGLDFDAAAGVQVNGSEAEYEYNSGNRELSLFLGDIIGQDEDVDGTITEKEIITVSFQAQVNESAYETTIQNTVSLEGENADGEATDDGTYVGSDVPDPAMEKKATNVTSQTEGTAVVGDVLEYAVTLSNSKTNSQWKNVVLTDTIPAGVDFDSSHGVYVNGAATNDYTYDEATRTLTVEIGSIEGGDSAGNGKDTFVATFQATVNESAYNTTVTNTAVGKGDNGEKTVTDEGTDVGSDTPIPAGGKVVKNLTRSSKKAQVGDRVRYTITVSNAQTNSVWENVHIWDTIPVGVDFDSSYGVYLNGEESEYTYDESTRLLTVGLGNIRGGLADGTDKDVFTVVFKATVNEDSYGKSINNIADLIGDNGEVTVDDGGIVIEVATTPEPDPTPDPISKYHVTYKANGGVGDDIATDDYEAGSIVAANKNTFTKDGYSFVNWNTKADGSGTSYEAGSNLTLDSNITLYATWKENSKQKTFNVSNTPKTSNSSTGSTVTSSSSGGKTASNVKTGDDTNLLLWVGILGLSCAIGMFLRSTQKNSRRKNNKAI